MNFSDLLRQQHQYLNTQHTKSLAARKLTLLRFKQMLEENEAKIYAAVHAGFDTFSHYKSVFKKPRLFEVPLKYPPYTPSKMSWIKRLLKLS
ncbi:MAG: hypothetical protein LW839_06505 [Cryomorphaceae bacterium]|jgi:hypothetical protein|nr:hypothetical protein [Cryomorphaceae bacterium]